MRPLDERRFLGWRVVAAAFVLSVFGWGLGLYGPPVYLHAVHQARGWPISQISTAVTAHFLFGAFLVARLPTIHRRLGVAWTTRLAGVAVALGVLAWSEARQPWQLFVAAAISGAGWAGTSAATVNAILSPWFVRNRAKALALAYNGASLGGVIFQPLWVQGILHLGFETTGVLIAAIALGVIWWLSGAWFARTPETLGQRADGDEVGAPASVVTRPWVVALPGAKLARNWQFQTLIAGTSLALFAQTGLLVHLLAHLVPALGAGAASWLMAGATMAAMGGRTVTGLMLGTHVDRRLAVAAAVALQLMASLVLLAAGGSNTALLVAGVLIFGLGLGNAVSLPPLIAQVEFARQDVPRVVSLTVAISQALYAFAPALFALLIELDEVPGTARLMFIGTALIQVAGIATYLAGRRRA